MLKNLFDSSKHPSQHHRTPPLPKRRETREKQGQHQSTPLSQKRIPGNKYAVNILLDSLIYQGDQAVLAVKFDAFQTAKNQVRGYEKLITLATTENPLKNAFGSLNQENILGLKEKAIEIRDNELPVFIFSLFFCCSQYNISFSFINSCKIVFLFSNSNN